MVIIGTVVALINPRFLAVQNLFNIILQVSVTGIICIGMGTVLISGNFDLTVGPQISILVPTPIPELAHRLVAVLVQRGLVDFVALRPAKVVGLRPVPLAIGLRHAAKKLFLENNLLDGVPVAGIASALVANL